MSYGVLRSMSYVLYLTILHPPSTRITHETSTITLFSLVQNTVESQTSWLSLQR